MKNRLRQAALLLGALSGGSFLALMITFYMGTPQPSTNFLNVVNQPALEASDNEKAWTIYRDLWIKHGFSEGGGFDLREIFRQDESGKVTGGMLRPSDGEAWHAATTKLESLADLLEGFRVGGVRPSFGVPLYIDTTQYSEEDFQALFPRRDGKPNLAKRSKQDSIANRTMISIPLPHVQSMRHAARLLVFDTRWAIEQGDFERATRNVEALLGISFQVTDSKILVASFVGFFVHSLALDAIEECMRANVGFSDQQLSRIQAAISRVRIEDMIDLNGERAMFMDVIQHAYTDDGNGDGRVTAAGLKLWEEVSALTINGVHSKGREWTMKSVLRQSLAPTSILFMASRKQLTDRANGLYDRVGQAVQAADGDKALGEIESEIKDLPVGYEPIKLLFPAFLQVRQAMVRTLANSNGALAAVAVIRYQRQHGRLPETLNDLVGEFLEQVPLDPLDGQPLRYQRTDDGFVIYSVGVNQTDDGGQVVLIRPDGLVVRDPSQEANPNELRPLPASSYVMSYKYPGDWILWPRNSEQ